MKILSHFPLLAPITALALLPMSVQAAETLTFDPSDRASDYASNLKTESPISVIEEDGAGLLSFRSEGGGELIIVKKDRSPIDPGDAVEVELRVGGQATFGILLRAAFLEEPAYLAFFSATPDGTIRLSISKTTFDTDQRPGETEIAAQKHIRGVALDDWLLLRFEVEELPKGGLGLRATVKNTISGAVLLKVEGEDTVDPLPAGGVLGLRFFTNRDVEEKSVDIRSITVE